METIPQMAKLQNSDVLHKVQGMFSLKIKGIQVWNLWSIWEDEWKSKAMNQPLPPPNNNNNNT